MQPCTVLPQETLLIQQEVHRQKQYNWTRVLRQVSDYLIFSHRGLQAKSDQKRQRCQYILVKGTVPQDMITVVNIDAANVVISSFIKQNLLKLKRQELSMVLHTCNLCTILGRLRQEDCHEFEASVGYITRTSKIKGKKRKKETETNTIIVGEFNTLLSQLGHQNKKSTKKYQLNYTTEQQQQIQQQQNVHSVNSTQNFFQAIKHV